MLFRSLLGGMDPSCIDIVYDELDAVRHAVSGMSEGELLVVCAVDVQAVLHLMHALGARG